MSNRTKKLNYKRVMTEDITGSGNNRTYRVGVVIPATCYGIRFGVEPQASGSEDIVFKWKVVRDLDAKDGETPEYSNELDADYMSNLYSIRRNNNQVTEYNDGLVIIDDIRLIDNHVLWIEHTGGADAAHPIEVMYVTGY